MDKQVLINVLMKLVKGTASVPDTVDAITVLSLYSEGCGTRTTATVRMEILEHLVSFVGDEIEKIIDGEILCDKAFECLRLARPSTSRVKMCLSHAAGWELHKKSDEEK